MCADHDRSEGVGYIIIYNLNIYLKYINIIKYIIYNYENSVSLLKIYTYNHNNNKF
jgi:hypothetical protein